MKYIVSCVFSCNCQASLVLHFLELVEAYTEQHARQVGLDKAQAAVAKQVMPYRLVSVLVKQLEV